MSPCTNRSEAFTTAPSLPPEDTWTEPQINEQNQQPDLKSMYEQSQIFKPNLMNSDQKSKKTKKDKPNKQNKAEQQQEALPFWGTYCIASVVST